MKRVSVTDLKNRLSEFLRLVKRGETIEILERRVPIARIQAAGAGSERAVRDGLLIPPSARPGRHLLANPAVPCRGDAVEALVDERRKR